MTEFYPSVKLSPYSEPVSLFLRKRNSVFEKQTRHYEEKIPHLLKKYVSFRTTIKLRNLQVCYTMFNLT